MGESAMIISSDLVEDEEFQDFLVAIGGVYKDGRNARGVLSEGESDIWIGMFRREFMEEFYDQDDLQEWCTMLGADPEVLVEIRLDHTLGSKDLYLKFSSSFGARWNSIFCDTDDSVLTYSLFMHRYDLL